MSDSVLNNKFIRKEMPDLMRREKHLLKSKAYLEQKLTELNKFRNSLQLEKLQLQYVQLDEKEPRRKKCSNQVKLPREKVTTKAKSSGDPQPPVANLDEVNACNQREIDLSITNQLTSILTAEMMDVESDGGEYDGALDENNQNWDEL